MKALTIEELKALTIGEYIWLVDSGCGTYAKIVGYDEDCFAFDTLPMSFDCEILDYGKTWLAYKNKEQAECKGVLKSLICDIGDKVYIVKKICDCFSIDDGIIECITIIGNTIYYRWNSYDYRGEQIELWDEGEFTADDLGKSIFLNYKQAEQKLKELRGGK